MLALRLLGGVSLSNSDGAVPARATQRRRLALLAVLAGATNRTVSRDTLVALLWPEANEDRAKHLLADSVYVIRSSLGEDVIVADGDSLSLGTVRVECDVVDFARAFEAGDCATAARLYTGSFLEGFHISKSSEFEHWCDATRAHLAGQHQSALEHLATDASKRGDRDGAVRWWQALAGEDQLNSRTTLACMHALAEAGNSVGAIRLAQTHEQIVRSELGSAADDTITRFAAQLRGGLPVERTKPSSAEGASLPNESAVRQFDELSEAESAERGNTTSVATPVVSETTATVPVIPPVRAFAALSRQGWRRLPQVLGGVMLALLISSGREPLVARASVSRNNSVDVDGKTPAPSVAAYELFVRGHDPILLRSDSGLRTGIDYLDRAIALEPNYAEAYGALAYLCATAAWSADHLSVGERRRMYVHAASAAREAVVLNDRVAEAHREVGYVKMIGYELTAATRELEHAIALEPGASQARQDLAKVYEWSERPSDALVQSELAVRMEPASASARAELGSALYYTRHYDEALVQLAHVVNLDPPLRRAPTYLAQVYASQGRWPEAITVLAADTLRQSRSLGLLGYALARSGAPEKALVILKPLLRTASDSGHAFEVAEIYAGLGELDLAFRWLDRALEDYSLTPSIMGPLFDDLRADRRFERIRQRLGLRRATYAADQLR